MKGDFSRITFNPDKHYLGAFMQQGRVMLDADWNEQQAITRHSHESAVAAAIGSRGVPNEGGGFAISLASDHQDLNISQGILFADGIQVENNEEEPVPLSNQPYLKLRSDALAGFTAPPQSGRFLVYLEAWERHVTSLEDAEIRESALGGIDTTTRTQLVWQVKLSPSPIGNISCEGVPANWQADSGLTPGKLSVQTIDKGDTSKPCILPPVAGYRGLDNLLYRVEIHHSGTGDGGNGGKQATLKWSRDNGSVVTAVSVSGQVLSARDLGRDALRGFAVGQWVEIIDQRMELVDHHGHLLLIEAIDSATREITIADSTPMPDVDSNTVVRLRRWDNSGAAASLTGIPLTTDAIALENDIEIQFSAGDYQSGDYWLITARTAINNETGIIEWPQDVDGSPLELLPEGVSRHYCPLALVDYNHVSGLYSLPESHDCRPRFPALTAIRAEDVSFDNTACKSHNRLEQANNIQQALNILCAEQLNTCSYIVSPESDLNAVVEQINSSTVRHASICFQAGEYHLQGQLAIGGESNHKGSIIISGFGDGTHLIAESSETFFRFENCASVTVKEVFVESRHVGSTSTDRNLKGVLTFVDCDNVFVEDTRIVCGSGPVQAATGITATRTSATTGRKSSVHIRRCQLNIGIEQAGILVFNAERINIEDNQIDSVSSQPSNTLQTLLNNKEFRAIARRALVSHAQYGGKKPDDADNVETIRYLGDRRRVYFRTSAELVGQWQEIIDFYGAPATHREMRESLMAVADRILMRNFDASRFRRIAAWRSRLSSAYRPAAAQGIVLAGSTSQGEIRVTDNTITGVLQGVTLGYSRGGTNHRTIRFSNAQIAGNHIRLLITPITSRHPEGIFSGNFSESLVIENNTISAGISMKRFHNNAHTEGIKVYGDLGPMFIVRHNHVTRVDSAIRVVPLNSSLRIAHRWLVADNLAAGFKSHLTLPENNSVDHIGNEPGGTSYTDLMNRIERLENSG